MIYKTIIIIIIIFFFFFFFVHNPSFDHFIIYLAVVSSHEAHLHRGPPSHRPASPYSHIPIFLRSSHSTATTTTIITLIYTRACIASQDHSTNPSQKGTPRWHKSQLVPPFNRLSFVCAYIISRYLNIRKHNNTQVIGFSDVHHRAFSSVSSTLNQKMKHQKKKEETSSWHEAKN